MHQPIIQSQAFFFGRFGKTQARKNSRIPKKTQANFPKTQESANSDDSLPPKIWSITQKKYFLAIIGFFAGEFNYLTTNCLFCSAFEYKNATQIPKSFMKHQKLKENHKKTQAFSQKTQGKTQKLKNLPTRIEMEL